MSIYSGKCDLKDHIAGYGGWFNSERKLVKIGDPNVNVYYSDEMLDFIAFKAKTGGVIHQHKRLKVDLFNQNFIAKKCDQFKIIEHKKKVSDKRSKCGYREIISYTYSYYGKEYTLKEINKRGVFITVDIHFDTLLDLIPYYPYIVTSACCDENKETVYISSKSYVDEEYEKHLQNGWESKIYEYYKKELQNHYREVVLTWFNPSGREVKEEAIFNSDRKAILSQNIDKNFPVEWYFDGPTKPHWTSPKIIDSNVIEISKDDYDYYLGNWVKVKYVIEKPYDLVLS